jgi:hypothetical protein
MKDLLSSLPKSEDFLAFWAIYPRKVAKLAAERAYIAARRKFTHEQIMDGVRLYPFRPDAINQPHATTFLNGGYFLIEEDTPPPTVIVARADTELQAFERALGIGDD